MSWTLIYETDSNGNQINGSLERLRSAVISAADVKVIYRPQANIWWSRNCSSIHVSRPGGLILVAATFMEAADTSPTGIGIDFDSPFLLEYHIYNSTGVRSLIKFNYQNHTVTSSNSGIVPMKWYVKDQAGLFSLIVTRVSQAVTSILGR
jgi:hypothetical protein